jgi:hypothetical protein
VRRNRSSIRDIVTSCVALLRAVNVGGKTLAMSAVRSGDHSRQGAVVKKPSSRSEGAHLVFEFQERAGIARLMKEIEGVMGSSHSPSSAGIERHNRAKPGIYSAAAFKPQNLTEREDHEHECVSRCFPWQQNQPENGGMDGPSRRATAGK